MTIRSKLAGIVVAAAAGVCGPALWSTSVQAATELSRNDLSGVASGVDNAINAAKAGLPGNATPVQTMAALSAAIASETRALIAQYGNVNPMIVAEAVITEANKDGALPGAIGRGMAEAALAEGATIGLEIADAVGATAPGSAVHEFETVANDAGGSLGTALAEAADSYQEIGAGGRGSNGSTMSFVGGTGAPGGGGGGGGGCKNPSCT